MQRDYPALFFLIGCIPGILAGLMCGMWAVILPIAAFLGRSDNPLAWGVLFGFFTGLCTGVVGPELLFGLTEGSTTTMGGPVDVGTVRKITLGEDASGPKDPMVGVLLAAAIVGLLVSAVGVFGAAWMLVTGDDDEDDDAQGTSEGR
ncbi:MAG: hypothetical protein KTR31_41320 [Myxococcales bacterium]|nr:hypothetical protein [Myxococcales bacterium]